MGFEFREKIRVDSLNPPKSVAYFIFAFILLEFSQTLNKPYASDKVLMPLCDFCGNLRYNVDKNVKIYKLYILIYVTKG